MPGTIKFTDHMANNLRGSQAASLDSLLSIVCKDEFAGHTTPIEYTVEVKPTTYGTFWVSIRPDLPTLPESNALRNCYRLDTWHVHIGKRGKLEAYSFPQAIKQFKGGTWMGIHIKGT